MARMKFTYTAGRLASELAQSQIKDYCFTRNYKFNIQPLKSSGGKESSYSVTVETLTDEQLRQAHVDLKSMMERM